jgi:archaellin
MRYSVILIILLVIQAQFLLASGELIYAKINLDTNPPYVMELDLTVDNTAGSSDLNITGIEIKLYGISNITLYKLTGSSVTELATYSYPVNLSVRRGEKVEMRRYITVPEVILFYKYMNVIILVNTSSGIIHENYEVRVESRSSYLLAVAVVGTIFSGYYAIYIYRKRKIIDARRFGVELYRKFMRERDLYLKRAKTIREKKMNDGESSIEASVILPLERLSEKMKREASYLRKISEDIEKEAERIEKILKEGKI